MSDAVDSPPPRLAHDVDHLSPPRRPLALHTQQPRTQVEDQVVARALAHRAENDDAQLRGGVRHRELGDVPLLVCGEVRHDTNTSSPSRTDQGVVPEPSQSVTELLHSPLRGLAPEVLQAVELARGGREDVHDTVEVVEQDPTGLPDALGAAGQQALLVLELAVYAVVDRLRLALGVARADHEEVGVADDAAEVDHA